MNVNLTGAGEPQRLTQARVTQGFFPFFGARPAMGRLLIPADRESPDLVVLSHGAWQTQWGSDPDIVGKAILIDDEPVTVVGVLDESFVPPSAVVERRAHVWRPLDWSDERLQKSSTHFMSVAARLRPGVALEAANAELDGLSDRMAERYPEDYVGRDGQPYRWPLVNLQTVTVQDWSQGLSLLLAAVGLLLLVACANVAHLFLARGLAREREIAVRRAVGASTGSLVSQLMVEALLVGLLGGALGIGFAQLGLMGFGAWFPSELPSAEPISMDLRILGVALTISALTALVFGLLPGIKTLGREVTRGLHGGGRTRTSSRQVKRFRHGLVMAEVALSLILMAQAGLLLRSFMVTTAQETGVNAENVWAITLTPTTLSDLEEYQVATREIMESLAAVPGVESVTRSLTLPFRHTGGDNCCWSNRIDDPDHPDGGFRVSLHPVDGSYFETLGIEFLAGGLWPAGASEVEPLPVVISEPMAIQLFGSVQAAVGRELDQFSAPRIVQGVIPDNKHYGLDRTHGPALYLPFESIPFDIPMVSLGVKVDPRAEGVAGRLRDAIWATQPNLPVPTVVPLESWISDSLGVQRFGSILSTTFGIVALLLAAGGLYGTLLYSVGQQRKELGIRMALGANPGQIQRSVLVGGLWIAGLGAVLGLFGAWGAGRAVESFLFGVEATDGLALGGATLILLAAAAAASWGPARKAARTDPLQTLNAE